MSQAEVAVKTSSSNNFQQEIKAGKYTFAADIPQSLGGTETAPTPHELLLGALGACTSITMQMYAKRKGWDLKGIDIKVSEEKSADGKSLTPAKINREIAVTGNLAEDQVESLKAIADKCPVHKLLSGNQISTSIKHG